MPSGGLETIESLPGLTGKDKLEWQGCHRPVLSYTSKKGVADLNRCIFQMLTGISFRVSYREFFKWANSMVIMPLHINAKQQNADCLMNVVFIVFVLLKTALHCPHFPSQCHVSPMNLMTKAE